SSHDITAARRHDRGGPISLQPFIAIVLSRSSFRAGSVPASPISAWSISAWSISAWSVSAWSVLRRLSRAARPTARCRTSRRRLLGTAAHAEGLGSEGGFPPSVHVSFHHPLRVSVAQVGQRSEQRSIGARWNERQQTVELGHETFIR